MEGGTLEGTVDTLGKVLPVSASRVSTGNGWFSAPSSTHDISCHAQSSEAQGGMLAGPSFLFSPNR